MTPLNCLLISRIPVSLHAWQVASYVVAFVIPHASRQQEKTVQQRPLNSHEREAEETILVRANPKRRNPENTVSGESNRKHPAQLNRGRSNTLLGKEIIDP
jgi:hypothetical protein